MHSGTVGAESHLPDGHVETRDIPVETRFMCNLLRAGMNDCSRVLHGVRVVLGAAAAAALVVLVRALAFVAVCGQDVVGRELLSS